MTDSVPVVPTGPWLVVLGMHRSGTSAVTGALGALGFNLPALSDRLDPHESNPDHFESLSVMRVNDALLKVFNGAWDSPPELPAGFEERSEVCEHDQTAIQALVRGFPSGGPQALKDPRICLLLPYWRRIIPGPLPVIFVWRSPLAVARSLRERNGFSLVHGIALWEHYNVSALAALEGLDCYVTSYESVLDNPRAIIAELLVWLDGQPIFNGAHRDADAAQSAIAKAYRHHDEDAAGPLLDSQQALLGLLASLDGKHRSFSPGALPAPSPWATDVLRTYRDVTARRAAERKIRAMRGSASWRITKPLRSLSSLARRGQSFRATDRRQGGPTDP
jgi:hypothetical protein